MHIGLLASIGLRVKFITEMEFDALQGNNILNCIV